MVVNTIVRFPGVGISVPWAGPWKPVVIHKSMTPLSKASNLLNLWAFTSYTFFLSCLHFSTKFDLRFGRMAKFVNRR